MKYDTKCIILLLISLFGLIYSASEIKNPTDYKPVLVLMWIVFPLIFTTSILQSEIDRLESIIKKDVKNNER